MEGLRLGEGLDCVVELDWTVGVNVEGLIVGLGAVGVTGTGDMALEGE
jgi:hypothetical protein